MKKISIAIVGSRTFDDYNRMKSVMDTFVDIHKEKRFVLCLEEREERILLERDMRRKADWILNVSTLIGTSTDESPGS